MVKTRFPNGRIGTIFYNSPDMARMTDRNYAVFHEVANFLKSFDIEEESNDVSHFSQAFVQGNGINMIEEGAIPPFPARENPYGRTLAFTLTSIKVMHHRPNHDNVVNYAVNLEGNGADKLSKLIHLE